MQDPTYDAAWTGYSGSFKTPDVVNIGSSMQVLNPVLYTALCNVFPEVTVIKNGVPYEGRVVIASGTGWKHIDRIEGGEEYHVNCPRCGDTRKRLYINHRWNTQYEGCRMRYSLFCHNEHCHNLTNFIDELTAMLHCGIINENKLNTDIAVNIDRGRPEIKGKFTRIDDLPDDHAAAKYLRQVRKLPVRKLAEVWGVSWADYSLTLPPDNRLFFPIVEEDPETPGTFINAGGQAHWLDAKTLIGSPSKAQRKEGEVKWYTLPGTRVSRMLYNGHIAKQQRDLIIITEGAFDVMRVGQLPGAEKYVVGVFGHNVSSHQKQLLWEQWGRHGATAILALDPDVYHGEEKDLRKVLQLEDWFKTHWNHFHALRLESNGTDIGDMPCVEIWDMINNIIGRFSNVVV